MADPEEIFVLNKKVRLLQPDDGFRTSLDSVMLAAACPARAGDRILDLGCGVGGAGLCVLWRVAQTHLTGIDIQDSHIALAEKNKALNGMEKRSAFLRADMRDYAPEDRFHHVICNPPYLEAGAHTPSPQDSRALALGHQEEEISLADWIDAAFNALASRGSFTIIHRADMTDKIIQAFGRRFGAIEIIPLWPRAGEAAKRVIIRAVKDRRSPAILHPGIVLHEADGAYTKAADAILRDGAAL